MVLCAVCFKSFTYLHKECTLGATARSWLVLRCISDSRIGTAAHFMAELRFRVIEVDPATGEIEGDEEGFQEEYPLEDVELLTADFMAKVCAL